MPFDACFLQHVLEHGKPHERSAIISKLLGQIVRMSQQKFASNVVEKCLTFGSPEERQLLIQEIIGSTDENEPLQVSHMLFCTFFSTRSCFSSLQCLLLDVGL